jgi:hypothetical protein
MGSNPKPLGPVASTLTTTPPRRLGVGTQREMSSCHSLSLHATLKLGYFKYDGADERLLWNLASKREITKMLTPVDSKSIPGVGLCDYTN